MRVTVLLAVAFAALAVPATAVAKGKVSFEDTVPRGRSSSVTITTHAAVSFTVVLRVPIRGRARLFLASKTAPKGGPLMDTKTYGCTRGSRLLTCSGSYEALPKGTYTWRIAWSGPKPAQVHLSVRW